MTLSAWFLNQTWTKISILENKVQAIELSTAAITANRFTSGDWVTQKNLLDAERMSMDRRIIKLEETTVYIKDSLVRIENIITEHLKVDKTYGYGTE